MDIKRSVLWVIFVVSLVMLYNNWQVHTGHPSMFAPSQSLPHTPASGTPGADELSSTPAGAPGSPASQSGAAAAKAQVVSVKTDMFDADISTLGGTLQRLQLLKE